MTSHFVGRKKHITEFNQSLGWALRRDIKTFIEEDEIEMNNIIISPLVFHLYGQGGFGKSSLIHQFLCSVDKDNCFLVKFDWDIEYEMPIPESSKELIDIIIGFCSKNVKVYNQYFKEVKKIKDLINRCHQAILNYEESNTHEGFDKIKKYYGHALNVGKIALGITTPTNTLMPPGYTINAIGELSKVGFNTIGDGILSHLMKKKKIKQHEFEILKNPYSFLNDALIKDLKELSKVKPVILILDAYEKIDNEEINNWVQKIFLKCIYIDNPNIITILSGRNNYYNELKNEINPDLITTFDAENERFSKTEILELSNKFGIILTSENAEKIRKSCSGMPLLIKDVINEINHGGTLEQIIQELETKTGTFIELIERAVRRFLRQCNTDEDYKKIYQLALLDKFDLDIISKIWKCSLEEANSQIKKLREKYSFIGRDSFHSEIRFFVRNYLVNIIKDSGTEKPIILKIGNEIVNEYNENIIELSKIKNFSELCQDSRYLEIQKSCFSLRFCLGDFSVLEDLKLFTLKLFDFNLTFAKDLIISILGLPTGFKTNLVNPLENLKNSYQFFLNNIVISNQTSNTVFDTYLSFLNTFESTRRELGLKDKMVLDLRFTEYYILKNNFDKAQTYIFKAHNISYDFKEYHLKITELIYLIGSSFEKKKEFTKAFKCFKKIPNSSKALHRIGHIFMNNDFQKKNCKKAIKFFEKALNEGYNKGFSCIANAYEELNDNQNVLKYLELEKNSNSEIGNDKLIVFYSRNDDFKMVKELCLEDIQNGKSNSAAFLGYFYKSKKDNLKKAEEYFLMVKESDLKYGFACHQLAHIYEKDNKIKTFEFYELAIKNNSESAKNCFARYIIKGLDDNEKQIHIDKAKDLLLDYIKSENFDKNEQFDVEAFSFLGWIFILKEDFKNALKYSKEASFLKPNLVNSTTNTALAFFLQKDFKKAKKIYYKVFKKKKTPTKFKKEVIKELKEFSCKYGLNVKAQSILKMMKSNM